MKQLRHKPTMVRKNVYLDTGVWKWCSKRAKEDGVSASEFIRRVLDEKRAFPGEG